MRQLDDETGAPRRVALDDDDLTLSGYDVREGTTVYLKVKPYAPKPLPSPPPWYNDFGNGSIQHN